jgi:hypothetical protein
VSISVNARVSARTPTSQDKEALAAHKAVDWVGLAPEKRHEYLVTLDVARAAPAFSQIDGFGLELRCAAPLSRLLESVGQFQQSRFAPGASEER